MIVMISDDSVSLRCIRTIRDDTLHTQYMAIEEQQKKRKGACKINPPTGPPNDLSSDCEVPAAMKHDGPPPRDLPYKTIFCAGTFRLNLKNL